jgi:hypothetical protein
MVQNLASQNILIRCHIFGGLSLNLVMPGSFDAAGKRCGDRRCNLVLNSENVLELSIVSFSPDVRFGLAVDKLDSDPDRDRPLCVRFLQQRSRRRIPAQFAAP